MWPFLAQADSDNNLRNIIDNLARTPLSVVLEWVFVITILRVVIYYFQKDVPAHKRFGVYAMGRFFSELFDAIVYAGVFVFMVIRPFFIQAFLIPSGSMVSTLEVNDFIVANKAIYRYTDPKEGDIVVFVPPKIACNPDQLDKDGNVNVDFIKRCIGVPGDTIEIRDNVLYRNGKAVQEPYKHFTKGAPGTDPHNPDQFIELTPDEVKQMPRIDFKLVDFNGQYMPVDINMQSGTVNYTEVAPQFSVSLSDTATAEKLRSLPPAKIPKGYYLMMGDNRNGSFDSRGWGLVPRESIIGRSEFIWMPIPHWGRTLSNPGVQ